VVLESASGQMVEFTPLEMLEHIRHVQKYATVRPRTFSCEFPFYIVISGARQKFRFGYRPEDLESLDTIEQKAWKKHQAHLNRLEQFPLEKAEYYSRLKEAHGIYTVRGLSQITGEDWSYIAKILKTLSLPGPIKDFLSNNKNDPGIIKFFHLSKLLDIVRQGEERLQLTRFRELIEDFHKSDLLIQL